MSLLSYRQICELIDRGVITGSHDNVNSASIDIVLGRKIMIEKRPQAWVLRNGIETPIIPVIDMLDKNAGHMEVIEMGDDGYDVPPGGCVLAESVEIFHLPNDISAEYKLKSTMARNFFNHLNAGWADAGWHGSVLTLEFVNHLQYHGTRIKPGMKAGQMIFFEHEEVPADRSYAARGQYNNDRSVTAGKGLK
jgi:deoxycytidine triphosphate deaminase